MRIAAIETFPLRIPFTAGGPMGQSVWGEATATTVDSLVVKVTTDGGIVGWGESFGFAAAPVVALIVDSIIGPELIGRDPAVPPALMSDVQRRFHVFGRNGPFMYAMSALDIALWDIAGKAVRESVSRLFAQDVRSAVNCYASLVRYADPDVAAANAERAVRDGFRHLKLHQVDVESVRAVREAVGDDVAIMLDANCAWSLPEATKIGKRLESYDLRWLEEPVWPPEDYLALARLREVGAIPIAAGENASTLEEFERLLGLGAVDVVQPSPAKMGGLSPLPTVFTLAAARNVTVMVHTFYDGPALLAGLHATAALGDPSALVEWRYMDLEARLYGAAIEPRDGVMSVPAAGGLGLEPDEDVLREYRMR